VERRKSLRIHVKHEGIQFLRFLSVFWVGIFHFFYFRQYLFSFKGSINWDIFALGWFGVRIFFIISGYVIFLSLNKSFSLINFLRKRALRLLPSIWIILPIVYIVQKYTPHSPFVEISRIENLIVSMTLIPPNSFNIPFNLNLSWISLVLWSLKVEIFFYILIGLIHFSRLRAHALKILFSIAILTVVTRFFYDFAPEHGQLRALLKVFDALGWAHLSWFCIGVFMAMREKNCYKRNPLNILVLGILLTLSLLSIRQEISNPVSYLILIIALLLTIWIILRKEEIPKSMSVFAKFGDSSYEMYLMHQGIGLTLALYACISMRTNDQVSLLILSLTLIICFFLSQVLAAISIRFSLLLTAKRRDKALGH
jgi:peptidoglycan/LPS O-acetylase OafA/YrhL